VQAAKQPNTAIDLRLRQRSSVSRPEYSYCTLRTLSSFSVLTPHPHSCPAQIHLFDCGSDDTIGFVQGGRGIATCKFRRLSLTIRRAAWSGLASSLGNEGEESCRTTNKCGMGRMALHYWASDTSTAPIGQSELLLTLRLGICRVQTALCIRICICIRI
jgi:hypothetical protein